MKEELLYLIKKVQFRGANRATNFLEKRSVPLIPYNWKKYKYHIFDGLTPEYGIQACCIKDKLVNVVYDTSTDNPVAFWQFGVIIFVEDSIDTALAVRLHDFFVSPPTFSDLEIYTFHSQKIEEYNRKIHNVLPMNRRRKVNVDNAFETLCDVSKIPFHEVGLGLKAVASRLESMYTDIITP